MTHLKLVKSKPLTRLSKFLKWLNKPRYIQFSTNSVLWGEVKKEKEFYEQIDTLYADALDHFMTIRTSHHINRIGNSVDFHPELYARGDAERLALWNIARVIKEGRVSTLFKKLTKSA